MGEIPQGCRNQSLGGWDSLQERPHQRKQAASGLPPVLWLQLLCKRTQTSASARETLTVHTKLQVFAAVWTLLLSPLHNTSPSHETHWFHHSPEEEVGCSALEVDVASRNGCIWIWEGQWKLLLISLFREQKTCRHRSLVQGITKCNWKIRCWPFTPVTGGAFFQHSLELAGAAVWLKWTRWEDFSDTEITWEQGPSIYVLIMLTYVECLIQKFIDFNKACKPWWKNVLSTKMCLSLSWTMTVHLPPNYLQHSGFL